MKIQFKTKSPYYEKERDGLKCNTVREVGDNDSRYDDLINWIKTKEESTITILNYQTNESFERQITDVTYYNERFIISWNDNRKSFEEVKSFIETQRNKGNIQGEKGFSAGICLSDLLKFLEEKLK